MNYDEIKRKIIYSKEMKILNTRKSPIKGFSDARVLADRVQQMSEYIAINNGLDKQYCGTLALAKYLGIPPYGREGRVAINEILENGFSQSEANLLVLSRILGQNCPERLKNDLISLNKEHILVEEMTEEAKVVKYAEEIYEYFYLLDNHEKEKLGGDLLISILGDEVKVDESGRVSVGRNFNRLREVMSTRKESIDIGKKDEIKQILQTRIMQATIDEQVDIDKIIGE